ncbi:dTDP-4-dehydrorhamnose reductase [Lachnospiraceae bacterium ZAX-1]
MKRILVTGCNGQLGRAVNLEYAQEDVEFINTDVEKSDNVTALDITNLEQVEELVHTRQPDVIINCAAHTAVDLCESQWDSAYRINALGPRNLSIAATKAGAKIIHISTDYVFSGQAKVPYTEFDEVGPNSAYGKTKLEGERFVQKFAKDYFIIRTAWLYGDGKNFIKTMLRLSESNDTVRVVGDQVGTPTSTVELAKMIHYLEPTRNYGLFHGTCEGSCSWAEFAKEIFKLAGKTTKVETITTAEFKTVAARPAYSILENYMLKLTTDFSMADWKDALVDYLKKEASNK